MLLIKKIRLVLHLVHGILTMLLLFPLMSATAKANRIRSWSQKALKLCGLRLVVEQEAPVPEGGVMLLCNHVSWIDVFAITSWQPVSFVAKAEVRQWPLIGWLAVQMNTVFLQRERRSDAKRIMHHLADRLNAGDTITVFPEGTTTDGRSLLPFHANLMQAPVSTGKPIQPLCLFYTDTATGRHTMAPAYIGETSLIESLNLMLSSPPMTVHLAIGTPVSPQEGQHRREFTQVAQGAVGAQLQAFLPEALLPQTGTPSGFRSPTGEDESDASQTVQI